jgi:general secretion pathway protein G
MIKTKRNRKNRFGFTMIEIMAVLIILGLLATLVATKVVTNIEKAREITTKTNLKTYHTAVNTFSMNHSRLPSEDEGLMALIEAPSDVVEYPDGGYLDSSKIETDGWKNEFIYEIAPDTSSGFLIRSCGPDGEPDTEDDIISTELN